MSAEFVQDIRGEWMVQIYCGDECLRVFWKPWALPYFRFGWGMYMYGIGPIGRMFWGAKGKR